MSRHKVDPGTKVRLADYDASDTNEFKDKAAAETRLAEDVQRLADLQERLYAENRRALLVVLQAMDTGGKDGTVKHVMSGVNPTGCQVVSFKAPSELEADHDFLWRAYASLPRRGNIGIFNRSHYEDVLVVRVHGLVPEAEWKRRFDQINRFEALISELGTRVLKFFLHIDKDEQKRRLEARLADRSKTWKFSSADIAERKHWDDYQRAYEDVLTKTSTDVAPWHIVPANKKWYRNLVVAKTIVKALEQMDPRPPAPTVDVSKIVID
jgi:PPK2 family polyphosphate:nucleotide phosphotransferase